MNVKSSVFLILAATLCACAPDSDYVDVKVIYSNPHSKARAKSLLGWFEQQRYYFTDTECNPKMWGYVRLQNGELLNLQPLSLEFNANQYGSAGNGQTLPSGNLQVTLGVQKGPDRIFGVIGAFSRGADCSLTLGAGAQEEDNHFIWGESDKKDIFQPTTVSGDIGFREDSLEVLSGPTADTLFGVSGANEFAEVEITPTVAPTCGTISSVIVREPHTGLEVRSLAAGVAVSPGVPFYISPLPAPVQWEIDLDCSGSGTGIDLTVSTNVKPGNASEQLNDNVYQAAFP